MNDEIRTDIENLESKAEQAHAAVTESRLSLEMVLEKHSEDLEKQRKHYCRIIYALILTLVLFVSSVVGGAIYLLANYDFGVIYQESTIGGSGDQNIYDGIHIDRN